MLRLSMSGETIETLLYRENKPILELKIKYPQIMGPLSKRAEFHFNDYYQNRGKELNRYARTELYRRAVIASGLAEEQEYGFTLHSLIQTFTAPRLDARYTSVITDRYQYFGGPHGMTLRTVQTWDFSKGVRVPLSYFFMKNKPYQKKLIKEICGQIQIQKENEGVFFFENPLKNAEKNFSEINYYLTDDSLGIYYPLYTLAPYHAGILSYKIPFDRLDGYWIQGRKPTVASSSCTGFDGGFTSEFL